MVAVCATACGGGSEGGTIDSGGGADGAMADAPLVDGPVASIDAGPGQPDAASCTLLPSGMLTRFAGNPLLRNGPETYDDLKTGPRAVVVMGPGDYRVWYEAVSSSGITAAAYATSADGQTWTKQGVVISPDLAWEESEISPNSVIVEGGLIKLWYHGGGYPGPGGQRLGNGRIGYATSPDGLVWTKSGDPVVDIGGPGSFDEQQAAEPRVLHLETEYRMYYTGRDANNDNALGMATSPDGVTWTKSPANPILGVSAWGQFWGGAIFREGSIWHMWRGDVGDGSSLRYMWSSDGIAWIEGPSNPVHTTSSDPGAADYGLVGDSVSGFRDGSTYRILYTGFNWNLFGSEGRFEGICMASIESPCP